MVDFFKIATKQTRQGITEIYPLFIAKTSSDLMIRGGGFYAIWLEDRNAWSTNEQDARDLIDYELDKYYQEHMSEFDTKVHILHLWDVENKMVDRWIKYCTKQLIDSFHPLDETLIFSNTDVKKKDYSSKRLPYPLIEGEFPSYEKLISTLYSPEDRHKIEWSIGSIVSGESKKLQKFLVLYGAGGTGKSTVIKIVEKLFEGYCAVFDAKALGSSTNSFALESLRSNPLVAIQHDGDLSHIEDNTRLNSVVSHELMTVNEKFKSTYQSSFKAFLFMATNKPVKITDSKSGLLRRLIDARPTGNTLPKSEYDQLMKNIDFELGPIAAHCKKVYLENPKAYDKYVPLNMLSASNDFYNYVLDQYMEFAKDNQTTLANAWTKYQDFCKESLVTYPMNRTKFKEELKSYFENFEERVRVGDGTRIRNLYTGFKTDIFMEYKPPSKQTKEEDKPQLIDFREIPSLLDQYCKDLPAQYASEDKEARPLKKWVNVKTTLKDLDTSKTHYLKVPEEHIVIDFDLCDENGNKSFEKNLEAASLWPRTYAELSKSGAGIHLHYIYRGDVKQLVNKYADQIEIKIFTGNSSLRRKLTKCNDIPIATISSGLPTIKGVKKVVNYEGFKNEQILRRQIIKCINKEYHPNTKPSIQFINKLLDEAYESGIPYDVTDLRTDILQFAAHSTHQADFCLKMCSDMKFKSKEEPIMEESPNEGIIFFDVEVFPNLFLICWKAIGEGKPVVEMFNPSPDEVKDLFNFKVIGFNNKRYDNHICYARMMGYSIHELYELSQSMINDGRRGFSPAYGISYSDIYDFAAADNKKSLKKFEIEMKIHHKELEFPWDQPVPEDRWSEVAAYCSNDVIATEATFFYLSADWTARQILADIAGKTVNDSTNQLTTTFIFDNDKEPQSQFMYRDLSKPVFDLPEGVIEFLKEVSPEMMAYRHGPEQSLLPYFPNYEHKYGKSTYKGVEVGEGGRVYVYHDHETGKAGGMFGNVALLDVSSMHPHSAINECTFGVRHTRRFYELVQARVAIKHQDWARARTLLNGALAPYIARVERGEMTAKDLANALKTAINIVYGLTAASFENAFRDSRNVDNIVAKRGALFMIDLTEAVLERGFTVVHIKTDSIKIADATPEIIQFVIDFGKRYGYSFEHEATYDRMCIVNDAVYIAKYATVEKCIELYGAEYVNSSSDTLGDNKKHPNQWTATGTQFQIPYVFKSLFSKEPIEFSDVCETKSVSSSSMYIDKNEGYPDVSMLEKQLAKLEGDYKHGKISDTTFEPEAIRLVDEIAKGHNYIFVGKVGSFCPVKPGSGGGALYRIQNGKYYNVNGTKDYLWLEAEEVQNVEDKMSCINFDYYETLVAEAKHDISEYCDFEWFVSDDPYISPVFVEGRPVYKEAVDWNEIMNPPEKKWPDVLYKGENIPQGGCT